MIGSGHHSASSPNISDLPPDVWKWGHILQRAAPPQITISVALLIPSHHSFRIGSSNAWLPPSRPVRGDTIWKDPEPLPFELFSWRWIPRRTLALRSLTAPSLPLRPSLRLLGVLSPERALTDYRSGASAPSAALFPHSSGSHDPRTLPRASPRVHCDFTKSATHLHAAARAPRPCVRVPSSGPCAPPAATSLLVLCGWIQKHPNHMAQKEGLGSTVAWPRGHPSSLLVRQGHPKSPDPCLDKVSF